MAAIFAGAVPMTASADALMIGLWQGVDSVDGSLRTIAITDRNGDRSLEVLANDTYWSICEGPGGLETVTGAVGDDGVLRTSGQIVCHSGKVLEVRTNFSRIDTGPDILLEEVVDQPFKTLLFRINQ